MHEICGHNNESNGNGICYVHCLSLCNCSIQFTVQVDVGHDDVVYDNVCPMYSANFGGMTD